VIQTGIVGGLYRPLQRSLGLAPYAGDGRQATTEYHPVDPCLHVQRRGGARGGHA
jgi:hypothetical protein